jgi:hypothetical protein
LCTLNALFCEHEMKLAVYSRLGLHYTRPRFCIFLQGTPKGVA